jgi:TonB family protein
MRSWVVSAALATAFVLTPAATGLAPARAQDFSITNQGAPADAFRRDLMRQLQAWWDVHAYYPRHASSADESGTAVIRLQILPDGNIWMVTMLGGAGSRSIDAAALATFRNGFVQRFPEGQKEVDIDLRLHYVLTRQSEDGTPVSSPAPAPRRPFTITNDLVKSPILDTMILKTCTGEVVRGGVRNHPMFGRHSWARAIFFRRPDGTPWVSLYEDGFPDLSPVTEVGKTLQWTGREEHIGRGNSIWTTYQVWPEGDNRIIGNIGSFVPGSNGITKGDTYVSDSELGGIVEFTCETQTVATPQFNTWLAQTAVAPSGDPP